MKNLTWLSVLLVSVGGVAACMNDANIASTNDSTATGGTTAEAGSDTGGTVSVAGAGGAGAGGAGAGGAGASGGTRTTAAGSSGIEELHSDLTPDLNPEISDADYAAFIDGTNRFGLDLAQAYTELSNSTTSNVVFSPSSAQVALAMAYAGAVGDTAVAMKTALHDPLPAGKYHTACNRMMRDLESRAYAGKDPVGNNVRIQLDYANSLWSDLTVGVKTPFLDTLGRDYASGMRRVDFIQRPNPSREAINAWVAQKTNDKILDLLSPADVTSATRIVLVNALYFYGSWEGWFDPMITRDASFHTISGSDVSVPTMHRTNSLKYKAGSNYEIVELPYTQGHLHFTLLLPSTGAFEAVRSAANQAFLTAATQDLVTTQVALALPKFSITTPQMNLNKALLRVGMGAIFTNADFSGISDTPLAVDTVVQKAFIGADEFGTEAAAATAASFAGAMPGVTPVTVDRPFLFYIQDESGLVLFSGQVVDPTQH